MAPSKDSGLENVAANDIAAEHTVYSPFMVKF